MAKMIAEQNRVKELAELIKKIVGFTGELGSKPDISCIYQNEAAKNYFIADPGAVSAPQETERF